MIVAIVGSTRFMRQIESLACREALKGHIVLRPHIVKSRVMHAPWTEEQLEVVRRGMEEGTKLADELLVCNVDGYVGQSTLRHIDLARQLGKTVTFEWPMLAAAVTIAQGKACLLCNGTGERAQILNGAVGEHLETCPRCHGTKVEP